MPAFPEFAILHIRDFNSPCMPSLLISCLDTTAKKVAPAKVMALALLPFLG